MNKAFLPARGNGDATVASGCSEERREAAELRTVIAHGRLTMREVRLEAARHHKHGLQIMTFEQLAARLAGGLSRAVDDDSLRAAIKICSAKDVAW